jgi:RimJ/RimL family protein N-acetyltransferase
MQWFRARLADPKSILYTALNRQGDPMGMVRYQLDGKRAILSINLGTAFRGRGNGRKLLFLTTEELFQNFGVTAIEGFVRLSNQPSIRLFEQTGFRKAGVTTVRGKEAIRYVLDRSA